jgi:hypothetical protein
MLRIHTALFLNIISHFIPIVFFWETNNICLFETTFTPLIIPKLVSAMTGQGFVFGLYKHLLLLYLQQLPNIY